MKLKNLALLVALLLCVTSTLLSQRRPREKKKLLAIGETQGWQHDATSQALATIWQIGQDSGLFDTYIKTDMGLITKKKLERNAKNLDYFDAVLFYTTGELKMDDQQKADLMSFIKKDGKGFIGVHSAIDTFYEWPEYGEMVGGYFDGHPWQRSDAPIIVEDRTHPTVKHFPAEFTIYDEIYQAKNFSRKNVRVLMRMDETKLDLNAKGIKRTDKDFAVAWVQKVGKGRMFYSTFGHTVEAWDRPDVQKMWLEAIKWSMGLTDGSAKPRPRP